jgi:hypothetical protein
MGVYLMLLVAVPWASRASWALPFLSVLSPPPSATTPKSGARSPTMEVTFQEARRHLGVETQRQWSELAIRRTTPALLGSVLDRHALRPSANGAGGLRDAPAGGVVAQSPPPTFCDALALVRRELLWAEGTFCGSAREVDTVKVPRAFVERLTETLCYAA